VVSGITEVQRKSQAMTGDMEALGSQAEDIGQIMNVISDIADQTNLLALNAAIEAARAGQRRMPSLPHFLPAHRGRPPGTAPCPGWDSMPQRQGAR